MRSTIVSRLGAAISVSALALSLGTVPSSATESPRPFSTKATVLEDRPNARLATGADLARAGASRASGSATITATPNANITQIKGHSGVLNNPDENYLDLEIWINDPEEIDDLSLYLTVDGKKTGPLPLWSSPGGFFVVVPDTVGLGKAHFYGTMIYYTAESGKAPKWDSTDSNNFYVRRDIYPEASAAYELSNEGKTKKFTISAMGIYSPSIHTFKGLSSIKLQYYSGGEWHTKKTLYPLVENGYATYTFTKTTKYYYRVISSKTSTWVGFKYQTPKI